MILPIIQAPDPRLLRPSLPVATILPELRDIVAALIDTRIFHRGAGLSAVQIGVHLRIAAVDPARFGGFRILINPEIVHREGKFEHLEGCLSIRDGVPRYRVKRARLVVLNFVDINTDERKLRLVDFAAAVAQHEIDHLDGKLIA